MVWMQGGALLNIVICVRPITQYRVDDSHFSKFAPSGPLELPDLSQINELERATRIKIKLNVWFIQMCHNVVVSHYFETTFNVEYVQEVSSNSVRTSRKKIGYSRPCC
ncbi:hypothetical protein TNCT_251761 [Trichonephila clavata]|uniref:Uncharacterized protein n=1 Tax=Trichonephila clavata TaxID=2740835 RepID=A0A8X6FYV3_TRICU|nr:hypothetical protein TNCT_251761 [Trichonephila clavata]